MNPGDETLCPGQAAHLRAPLPGSRLFPVQGVYLPLPRPWSLFSLPLPGALGARWDTLFHRAAGHDTYSSPFRGEWQFVCPRTPAGRASFRA